MRVGEIWLRKDGAEPEYMIHKMTFLEFYVWEEKDKGG